MRALTGSELALAWAGAELDDHEWSFDCGGVTLQSLALESTTGSTCLAQVRNALEHGPGIARLRGLSLESASTDAEAHMRSDFVKLAHRIGEPLSQTSTGETVLDVRDRGYAPGDPRFRGPHSRRPLRFHSDRCDVIAFLCVRPALSGGDSEVLSSAALYERLRAREPEVCATLLEVFPYLRHTIDDENPHVFTEMPVFAFRDGYFHASLLRVLIDRADADPRAPDLSTAQRDALDTLERVADEPGLACGFRLERGDLLWIDNWRVMHRRSAFVDDAASPRLLLRVWLSVPWSRSIDERYCEHFGATEAGALRGGIRSR